MILCQGRQNCGAKRAYTPLPNFINFCTVVNQLSKQFNFKSFGVLWQKIAKPQTSAGGFTVTPRALRDFHLVKVINALYELCPSKTRSILTHKLEANLRCPMDTTAL